ncbi:MAG: signal peptidase I [Lachnospiraceae bacterium]|nr:signal peptidase I [Lachnospiraceae bacterium]
MKRDEGRLSPEQAIRRRRIQIADRREAWALFRKILVVGAAVYILFGVLFGVTSMKGGDMQPRFAAGDVLLYYRLHENYVRNDVVVMERGGTSYVGRIIGIPGDTLEITREGALIINGNRIVETEIYFPTERYQGATEYPITLAGDEYFLMGDHRITAKDSRYFGPVRAAELKGKVITAIRRTDL